MTNPKPIYIYFHIPKTGGTSFNWKVGYHLHKENDRWLKHFNWVDGFGGSFVEHNIPLLQNRTQKQHEQLKIISGHSTYSHTHFWLKEPRVPYYMAHVREPVPRLLSSFNYRFGLAQLNQDTHMFSSSSPVSDTYARYYNRQATDYNSLYTWRLDNSAERNLQCKWLLKCFYAFDDTRAMFKQYSKFEGGDTFATHQGQFIPQTWPDWFYNIQMDDNLFDMLIEVLKVNMWYLGTTENLNKDTEDLCKHIDHEYVADIEDRNKAGVSYPQYWNLQDVLGQPDYEEIIKEEKYDQMLYEFAKSWKRPY